MLSASIVRSPEESIADASVCSTLVFCRVPRYTFEGAHKKVGFGCIQQGLGAEYKNTKFGLSAEKVADSKNPEPWHANFSDWSALTV